MIKDCTTVEQGLMLLNAGMPPETADKCWLAIENGDTPSLFPLSFEQAKENRATADSFLISVAKERHPGALTPAWSLTTLLEYINVRYYTSLFHDGVAWTAKAVHHDDSTRVLSCFDALPVTACVKLCLDVLRYSDKENAG